MTTMKGPLARLDSARDELAKAWLVRLIERASLDEIKELPTERIAREMPDLITGVLLAVSSTDPFELSDEQHERAAALAALRAGRESAGAEVGRDMAALHSVLVRAMKEEFADDPDEFSQAVERLGEATSSLAAVVAEEMVSERSLELEAQANTDALTGLYNLRFVQTQLEQLLELHKRYGHPFSLLLMDVDGLKRINDSHGHQTGDRLLKQVAVALRRSVRTVDTAARLGGDEFCVLASNQSAESAVALAVRLAKAADEEFAVPEMPTASLSIGVVSCPEHADTAERLIDLADQAMYRAKAAGERVAIADPAAPKVAENANS